MANAAPKIVARNFHEAHTFAREVLKLSQGTYRVVANPAALFGYGEVHLVPGWDKRPDRFAVRNKLRYTRLTVIDHSEDPAEVQDESSNGDNMVSEGGPVFTIFSDPEAWLKSTEESLRPADSNPLFVVPEDLLQEIADGGIQGSDLPSLFEELKKASIEVTSEGGQQVAATLQAQEDELKELDEDIDVKEDDSDNDVEEDERPLNGRRRRRCKDCGDLIHPDDVEEHAASEAAKKAALEKKAQERLK